MDNGEMETNRTAFGDWVFFVSAFIASVIWVLIGERAANCSPRNKKMQQRYNRQNVKV
jgi:hypothetical protein